MRDDVTNRFATSRIRDDAGHWDARAEQVAADVVRELNRGGFEWLGNSRRMWVAACLLMLVALLSVVSSGVIPVAQGVATELTNALAPVDDIGRAIVLPDRPPAIGALLLPGGT